jgi:1-phosphofructokinase family hexose kinase
MAEGEISSLLKKVSLLAKPNDWWVLAGSLAPGMRAKVVADIIHIVHSAGAHAVVDMEGESLRTGCHAGAFLIKPNDYEASILTGNRIKTIDDACKAAGFIHQMGASRVAISMGSAGAMYSDGTDSWWAKPPVIYERNPIGAGDAMLAGLIWALQNNYDGGEVLKWGIACGAAAASLDGTAFGPYQMVESLSREIYIIDCNSHEG